MTAQKEEKDDKVIFVKGVPEPLRRGFKAWCADRGVSMKDAFLTYMKEAVATAKGKGKSK